MLVGRHQSNRRMVGSRSQLGRLGCRKLGVRTPKDGLRMLDKASKQIFYFSNGWQRVASPAMPSGGRVVDTQARDTISNLGETLRKAGILPAF
jgi:hypothetical protein